MRFGNLHTDNLVPWAKNNEAALQLGSARLPELVVCGMYTFDAVIGGTTTRKCTCLNNCCTSKLCQRSTIAGRGLSDSSLAVSDTHGHDELGDGGVDDEEGGDDEDYQWLSKMETSLQEELATATSDEEAASMVERHELAVRGVLEKRGRKKPYEVNVVDMNDVAILFTIFSLRYYSPSDVPVSSSIRDRAYTYWSNMCWAMDLRRETDWNAILAKNSATDPLFEMEHTLERQTLVQSIRASISGVLSSGDSLPRQVDGRIWRDLRNHIYPPSMNVRPLHNQANVRTAVDRMFSAFGTKRNDAPFFLLPKKLNELKGRMFKLDTNLQGDRMNNHWALREFTQMIDQLREVGLVLRYLSMDGVREAMWGAYRELRDEMVLFSNYATMQGYQSPNLATLLDTFFEDHARAFYDNMRRFVREERERMIPAIQNSGLPVQVREELLEDLLSIWAEVIDFSFDFTDWFG